MTAYPAEKLAKLKELLQFAAAEDRELIERAVEAIEAQAAGDPEFVDATFPHQAALLADQSRFLAMVGPRRKGKSNTIARKMLARAWKHPAGKQGFQSMYIGLTGNQARISFWEPALKPVLKALGIDAHLDEQKMTCRLPNGHVIYVMGMDSQDQIKERARGGGYATVAVDEAATFMLALDAIFSEVVEPAVADVLGTVILAGTPGYVRLGLFFRVTGDAAHNHPRPDRWRTVDQQSATEWSVHRWTGSENPYMRAQLEGEIARKLALNPDVEALPSFQREWRGLWVLDDSKLVYRYAARRNDYSELPQLPAAGWHWGLVCDLGYSPDPLAMGVLGWHDHEKTLYVDEATEELELLTSQITARVHAREQTYLKGSAFEFYVIDGAEKRAVEEMRRRDGIPWVAADKRGKSDFIEQMNNDWLLGKIKVHQTRCAWQRKDSIKCGSLVEELTQLVWDPKELAKGNRVESSGCANHATDMVLYGWRHAYPYLSAPPVQKPKYGSIEYFEQEEANRLADALRRARERQEASEGGSSYDPWKAEQDEPSDLRDF